MDTRFLTSKGSETFAGRKLFLQDAFQSIQRAVSERGRDNSTLGSPVYGELLFRQATWDATLLQPFLYVIDSKRAFNFGEAHVSKATIGPTYSPQIP